MWINKEQRERAIRRRARLSKRAASVVFVSVPEPVLVQICAGDRTPTAQIAPSPNHSTPKTAGGNFVFLSLAHAKLRRCCQRSRADSVMTDTRSTSLARHIFRSGRHTTASRLTGHDATVGRHLLAGSRSTWDDLVENRGDIRSASPRTNATGTLHEALTACIRGADGARTGRLSSGRDASLVRMMALGLDRMSRRGHRERSADQYRARQVQSNGPRRRRR